MAVKKFEDLLVWQKAQDFAVAIYQNFSDSRDYSFKDQILRASISISNNIAEGLDRSTNPDFISFLYFATSSNSEVRSMLYLSKRLNFFWTLKRHPNLLNNQTKFLKCFSGSYNQ
ncbi:four helix bundle protein [Zobellia galactanivorans]|uniref:Four helix bundle protein n=1 Tax=Zobellia galactanivorans (strain DSM 12802 / CCUG 47099 / CIP 106680 / NCIMB 13871 / Dsij) TaxID=63186 RepID=G0LAI6_ZOBGA|nr:Conserved hypothetical protein [Zobellia galactanivorans]